MRLTGDEHEQVIEVGAGRGESRAGRRPMTIWPLLGLIPITIRLWIRHTVHNRAGGSVSSSEIGHNP